MTAQGGGRYAWQERIAAGGMGEVWKAEDTRLHREVAVKVLKPELADDPRFRERFANEARMAATLHHPNIATVFDYGESGGDPPRPYLVMELVRGRPLSDLIRPGSPMPAAAAVPLVTQAAQALAAAHTAGIVHRDIKPGNILVTPDRQVKVTDFGIARASDTVALTGTGEVLGTPHYLSPEQAEGRTATPASDVYALGVVLFELLTGRRPFSADSAVATALAHVQQPVPDLPREVPADLARVVRRAMAKDPAQRFGDGAAFAAALADPASAGGVPGADSAGAATQVFAAAPLADPDPAPTRVTRAVPPVAPVTPVAARRDDDEDERRSGSVWPWVLGAAALALVLLVAFLIFRPSGNQQPTDQPSDSPSASASTVQLTADDYVGRPLDEARNKLNGLGFDNIDVVTRDNPGGEDAGTVAAISPTGTVKVGAPITLTVWGDEPKPTPTPSDTQTPSDTPSDTPTPTPSDTTTPPGQTKGPGGNGNGNGNGKGNGKAGGGLPLDPSGGSQQ